MEVNERVAGEEDEDKKEGEGEEKGEKQKETRKLTKDEIVARFESGGDIFSDEVQGPLPEGRWRVGRPCAQADVVLMRIAATTDEAEAIDPIKEQELRTINMQLSEFLGRKTSFNFSSFL